MVDNYAQHAVAVFLHVYLNFEELMSVVMPDKITHTQVQANQALGTSILFDGNNSSSGSRYAFHFMIHAWHVLSVQSTLF